MSIKKVRKQSGGFSLIELMIVVAIIGIIAAVALPSYSKYMEKTRRLDATSFLIEAAGEQVRFFSENNRYGAIMGELGYGADDAATTESEDGHYTISVESDTETSFVLTATPVAGGLQAGDTECGSFTLNSSEQKGVTGTIDAANCW